MLQGRTTKAMRKLNLKRERNNKNSLLRKQVSTLSEKKQNFLEVSD